MYSLKRGVYADIIQILSRYSTTQQIQGNFKQGNVLRTIYTFKRGNGLHKFYNFIQSHSLVLYCTLGHGIYNYESAHIISNQRRHSCTRLHHLKFEVLCVSCKLTPNLQHLIGKDAILFMQTRKLSHQTYQISGQVTSHSQTG